MVVRMENGGEEFRSTREYIIRRCGRGYRTNCTYSVARVQLYIFGKPERMSTIFCREENYSVLKSRVFTLDLFRRLFHLAKLLLTNEKFINEIYFIISLKTRKTQTSYIYRDYMLRTL